MGLLGLFCDFIVSMMEGELNIEGGGYMEMEEVW